MSIIRRKMHNQESFGVVRRNPPENGKGGNSSNHSHTPHTPKQPFQDVIDPSPSFLPNRVLEVQASPDELIFAYEWAQSPNEPQKALKAAGLITKSTPKEEKDEVENEYTNNNAVLRAFQEALMNRIEAIQITQDRIDAHQSLLAFTDIAEGMDKEGNWLPLQQMPWKVRMSIQEYEEKSFFPPKGLPYKQTKIKFYSRQDALKTLRQNRKEDREYMANFGANMSHRNSAGDTYYINNVNQVNQQNNFEDNHKEINFNALGDEDLRVLVRLFDSEGIHERDESESMLEMIEEE